MRLGVLQQCSRTKSRRTDDTVHGKPEAGAAAKWKSKSEIPAILSSHRVRYSDNSAAKLAATAVKQGNRIVINVKVTDLDKPGADADCVWCWSRRPSVTSGPTRCVSTTTLSASWWAARTASAQGQGQQAHCSVDVDELRKY